MHVLIECWKARPSWSQLSDAQRSDYLASVVPAIRELFSDGVELVAMEVAENGNGHRHEYDYWAVWQLPHRNQIRAFARALRDVGWFDHFEGVELDVEGRTVEDIRRRQMPADQVEQEAV